MNVDESPVLNNQYAAPRDYQELMRAKPIPRRIKETTSTGIYPEWVQRLLSETWRDIADYFYDSGLTKDGQLCDQYALRLELVANRIKRKKSHEGAIKNGTP